MPDQSPPIAPRWLSPGQPRRSIMHAAVAAGGASAILMSTAVNGDGEEARTAAGDCLDPLLRAVVHAIDAAEGLGGSKRRAGLRDVLTDFLETAPGQTLEAEPVATATNEDQPNDSERNVS